MLWASKDHGQVEAVVGPYKLYDHSFRMLQGTEWLSDEVIDAFIHHLIKKQQKSVYHLCAAVSTSIFSGKFPCLLKMKFPTEDTVSCEFWSTLDSFCKGGKPTFLKIVCMSKKTITIVDPLGKEDAYERKVLRNWRNFLKMRDCAEHNAVWQVQTRPHELQQDSSSCGVLILKFAEHYLSRGHVSDVKTSQSAVSASRMEIACALLECRGNVEDYCVVCSMLEGNADESMIEMVQCDLCSSWAHFKCAKYKKHLSTYVCDKCSEK